MLGSPQAGRWSQLPQVANKSPSNQNVTRVCVCERESCLGIREPERCRTASKVSLVHNRVGASWTGADVTTVNPLASDSGCLLLKACYLPLNFEGGLRRAFPYFCLPLNSCRQIRRNSGRGHDYTSSALSVSLNAFTTLFWCFEVSLHFLSALLGLFFHPSLSFLHRLCQLLVCSHSCIVFLSVSPFPLLITPPPHPFLHPHFHHRIYPLPPSLPLQYGSGRIFPHSDIIKLSARLKRDSRTLEK